MTLAFGKSSGDVNAPSVAFKQPVDIFECIITCPRWSRGQLADELLAH
jgi:hypothetical protein